MLVFDRGDQRFCYRAAAVILDRGRVLLQEDTLATPFWVLPGGRMEHGESGWECIAREMREELEEDVSVERLLWFVENFFEHQGMKWHEVGLYFLVSLAEGSRFLRRGAALGCGERDRPHVQAGVARRRETGRREAAAVVPS